MPMKRFCWYPLHLLCRALREAATPIHHKTRVIVDFAEALYYCFAHREYDKHTFPRLERMEGCINCSPAVRLAIPDDQNCIGFRNDLQISFQGSAPAVFVIVGADHPARDIQSFSALLSLPVNPASTARDDRRDASPSQKRIEWLDCRANTGEKSNVVLVRLPVMPRFMTVSPGSCRF